MTETSLSIRYDAAGNLWKDTYIGSAVTRTYDAENRMTQEMQTGSYVAGVYPYDGVGGELIGEYAANGSASTPQKEYGYRNGQLLITATVTSGSAASAFSFTDAPIVAGTTTIKALHLTELRTAVDQARVHAGLFFLAG